MPDFFEIAVQRIVDSLRFFTSPIDPITRKGGGMSRKEAIEMTKPETMAGPKVWKRAFEILGWE
jgi:hypothetical protein